MKNRFMKLEGNSLILVENMPEEINSEIEFDIHFPQGAILENLLFKGTVKKCVAVPIVGENSYLLGVDISNLTETHRLILQAYLIYLDREKQMDEIHTNLDFERFIRETLSNDQSFDDNSTQEYLNAKLKDISFH